MTLTDVAVSLTGRTIAGEAPTAVARARHGCVSPGCLPGMESNRVANGMAVEGPVNDVNRPSINRLVCLSRHWTWADEAMARFERSW